MTLVIPGLGSVLWLVLRTVLTTINGHLDPIMCHTQNLDPASPTTRPTRSTVHPWEKITATCGTTGDARHLRLLFVKYRRIKIVQIMLWTRTDLCNKVSYVQSNKILAVLCNPVVRSAIHPNRNIGLKGVRTFMDNPCSFAVQDGGTVSGGKTSLFNLD